MQLERIGPYRILRLLGKGGMGAVYEGLHEAIERRVAIKVLHAELGRRADMATRFINEARAVNRIDHPGLVAVSDFGQLPDGMAYIVMEFLKGETLGQRLKRINSRLPTNDVIRLGRQMIGGMAPIPAAKQAQLLALDQRLYAVLDALEVSPAGLRPG